MAVTKDGQGLTVQTARFVQGRGPVFYGSLPFRPAANETLEASGTNGAGDKHRLVSILWDHLAAREGPLGKRYRSFDSTALQVLRGPLGRPYLLLGAYLGPAISFSEGGGKVWAALCGDTSAIGIDVAGTDEFPRGYPFHRVFHPPELQQALRLAGEDLGKASALLWSVKEAVVKALGCAFHLVAPRQILVYPAREEEGGYAFPVGLSRKAQLRFPPGVGRSLWVRSLPQEKGWLSIALWNG